MQTVRTNAPVWLAPPHVVLRPRFYRDEGVWCCELGDCPEHGLAGYGLTTEAAAADFDEECRSRGLGDLDAHTATRARRRLDAARRQWTQLTRNAA